MMFCILFGVFFAKISLSILNNAEYVREEAELFHRLAARPYDMVVIGVDTDHAEGLRRVQAVREIAPFATLVVIVTEVSLEEVVEYARAGVASIERHDSVDLPKLIEKQKSSDRRRRALEPFITTDMSIRLQILRAADALSGGYPVLVSGETGTGKELVARAIHDASGRPGRYVVENLSGVDDTFVSDTLFGHQKGAFTGAQRDRLGRVAHAERGTLFLDEIGDLSPRAQVKILRLLENQEYYPLGSANPIAADVCFVGATNQPLEEMVLQGRFRADLYYRLAYCQVTIPPLRERPGDLELLVSHFVTLTAEGIGKAAPSVHPETIRWLSQQPLPGNVRELRSLVINAVTMCRGDVITPDLFVDHLDQVRSAVSSPIGTPQGVVFPSVLPSLDEINLQLTAEALRRSSGNQSAAATLIGITPSGVNKRIRRNASTGAV